jgi:acetyltransferase-like isoleucine patch superfamily enzyme
MNDIGTEGIDGWVVAMRLQSLFMAIDVFESVLIAVPGLFSFWLRCWGSKVGKGVVWTPHCKVYDRYLVDIGDDVIVGTKAIISTHAVIKRKGRIKVFCKKIHIGKGTVIGGEVLIGPGANIGENCQVNARSIIWVNETIADNTKVNRCR